MSKTLYKPGTFIQIPSKYLLMEVDAISQSVFLWLCSHADRQTGACFPSIERLSKLCKYSKGTIKNRIKELEKVGLIKKTIRKTEDGRNLSNLYHIIVNNSTPIKKNRSIGDPYRSLNDLWVGQEITTNNNHTEQKSYSNRKNTRRFYISKNNYPIINYDLFFNRDAELISNVIKILHSETHKEEELLEIEIDKFISYWTEPDADGTKCRWEFKETFDVWTRLNSWLLNMHTSFKQSNNIREI